MEPDGSNTHKIYSSVQGKLNRYTLYQLFSRRQLNWTRKIWAPFIVLGCLKRNLKYDDFRGNGLYV